MSENKRAPTPGPDDTVRVSRKLAQRILDRIECETGDPVAVCADLRAALSTPPASPDAGRVERVAKASENNPDNFDHQLRAVRFLAMLDAALAKIAKLNEGETKP